MKVRSPFLFPFWMMGGIVIFRIFLYVRFVFFVLNYPADLKLSVTYKLLETAWPVLFMVELIIYWKIRYRIFNKAWVHIHIWSTFLIFVIFPVSLTFYRMLIPFSVDNGGTYNQNLTLFFKLQYYVFWSLVVTGHLFFIATLIKSYSTEESLKDEPAAGLLDEFID